MSDPRMIPGLTLEQQDRERGSTITYKARCQQLDEVLEGICRAAGLSYKFVWSGSGLNFVFTVDEGTDLSSTVTISTGFGNVKSCTFLNAISDMKNVLYMGGDDTGADRLVQEVYDGSTEPEGWARREIFIDASDCTTAAELTARGEEELVSLGESVSLEVEYLQGSSFQLGRDFDVGDTVTINYPGVVEVVSRIISSKEVFAPNQPATVTLGISKEYPDLKSVMKVVKKEIKMAGRK